jgi:hypothetical protein
MATVPSARAANTRPLTCLQHTTSEVKVTSNNILKFLHRLHYSGLDNCSFCILFCRENFFSLDFFASTTAPQIPLCQMMLGLNPYLFAALAWTLPRSHPTGNFLCLIFFCCKFVVFCYAEEILLIFQVANIGN